MECYNVTPRMDAATISKACTQTHAQHILEMISITIVLGLMALVLCIAAIRERDRARAYQEV